MPLLTQEQIDGYFNTDHARTLDETIEEHMRAVRAWTDAVNAEAKGTTGRPLAVPVETIKRYADAADLCDAVLEDKRELLSDVVTYAIAVLENDSVRDLLADAVADAALRLVAAKGTAYVATSRRMRETGATDRSRVVWDAKCRIGDRRATEESRAVAAALADMARLAHEAEVNLDRLNAISAARVDAEIAAAHAAAAAAVATAHAAPTRRHRAAGKDTSARIATRRSARLTRVEPYLAPELVQ